MQSLSAIALFPAVNSTFLLMCSNLGKIGLGEPLKKFQNILCKNSCPTLIFVPSIEELQHHTDGRY